MIFLQNYKKKNNVFNIFGTQIPNITEKSAFKSPTEVKQR